MNIQLRFFASVREQLNCSQESISVPEHVRALGDVRSFLRERGSPWAETLAEGRALRMAYDQVMSEPQTRIAEGGEVAFFPPVTGG